MRSGATTRAKIALVGLFWVIFGSYTYAASPIIYEYDADTGGYAFSNRDGGAGTVYQGIAYTTSTTYFVDRVGIEISTGGTPTSTGFLTLTVRRGGANPDGGVLIATSTINNADLPATSACSEDNFEIFEFSPPFALEAATTTYFRIENSINQGITPYRGICYDGAAPDWYYPASWTNGAGVTSMQLYGYGLELDFIYPTGGAAVAPFAQWAISRYIPAATVSGTYWVNVDYSRTSSSTFEYYDQLQSSITDEYLESNIPVQDGAPLLPAPAEQSYYARLRLSDAGGDIAATDPIFFTVGIGSAYQLPSSTATSSAWTLTCDPADGAFVYSICSVLLWAFVPSWDVFDDYMGLWEQVSLKPPIGYLTAIIAELNGVGSSTPAYAIGTVDAFAAFFSPIKTALTWVLGFLFAFWIFNRVRHLEL